VQRAGRGGDGVQSHRDACGMTCNRAGARVGRRTIAPGRGWDVRVVGLVTHLTVNGPVTVNRKVYWSKAAGSGRPLSMGISPGPLGYPQTW